MAVPKKVGSRKWRVRWRDESGGRRQRTFTSRAAADLWCAEIETSRAHGSLARLTPSSVTLEDLAVEWVQQLDIAPSTLNTYRSVIEPEIMRRMGTVKVERIGRLTVDQWMGEMKRAGLSADRRGRALMYLRSILDYGVVTERIGTNPAAAVKRPKVPAKEPKLALAPAQIEAIASHMSRPEDVMYLRLMAYAGLRPGEVRGLKWDALQKRTLIVNAGKTNRYDAIDLLDPLAANLKEFKLLSPDKQGQIIPGEWTKTELDNWRKRIFNRAAAAAGWGSSKERTRSDGRVVTEYSAEITPYNLRHSYASLLIHAGRPLTYVAAQMRHSLEMTMRTYAHVIADLDHTKLVDPVRLISQSQGELWGNSAKR